MSDPIQSTILVMSDLHFGADFLLEAEIDPLQVPFWLKYTAPKVRRFFEDRCKAHDMAIVLNLPKYLKKVLRQLKREEFARSKFDLLVLLGDLATYANGGSYSFLGQYLSQAKYQYASEKSISGLKDIYNGELIAIPGNHDKLLRTNLDLFHSKFSPRTTNGAQPQPHKSFFISRIVGSQEFLFVLLEASKYASVDGKLDFSALSHLASGEVTKDLRDEVTAKFSEIRNGHSVDNAQVKDFGLAWKIILVHYAVDDRMVLGPAPQPQGLVLSHRCNGLDSLIKDLAPSLNLVLHGHLHCPRIYNHHGVPVISTTTTTQKDGVNGFFVMKLLTSGDIVIDHHRWNVNGFMKDETAELSVRIARTPAKDSRQSKTVSKQAAGQ
jgi:predicted phosphodiesterase